MSLDDNQGRKPEQIEYSEKVTLISIIVILGVSILLAIIRDIDKIL